MKPIESEDIALAAHVLPALRMMRQFPTRSIAVASFYTDISEDEIRKFVLKYGRPTGEMLEDLMFRITGKVRRLSDPAPRGRPRKSKQLEACAGTQEGEA